MKLLATVYRDTSTSVINEKGPLRAIDESTKAKVATRQTGLGPFNPVYALDFSASRNSQYLGVI